jgi:GTP cyclohydrolase II
LRPASWTRRPAREAAALLLTALNTTVRIHVESVGLDDAGSRRRLCEQPYHHAIERAGRMEELYEGGVRGVLLTANSCSCHQR